MAKDTPTEKKNSVLKWTLIAIFVLVLVIIVLILSFKHFSDRSVSGQKIVHTGSESNCSQGAQNFIKAMDSSSIQVSAWTNSAPVFYSLVNSHYVPSQDSCYLEIQAPQSSSIGSTTGPTDTLYVANGPTGKELQLGNHINALEVATCSNQNQCTEYDPTETITKNGIASWTPVNTASSSPSMSFSDFETLVQNDMSAT